jgi:hypothetical protein
VLQIAVFSRLLPCRKGTIGIDASVQGREHLSPSHVRHVPLSCTPRTSLIPEMTLAAKPLDLDRIKT